MFTQVLAKIGMLFLIMAVGAVIRLVRLLNEDSIENLSKLVTNITLPVLYFYNLSTQVNLDLFKTIWYLPFFAVGLVILSYNLGRIFIPFLKFSDKKNDTFLFLATFTNYGFLAIPIAFALFGEKGLSQVAIFNMGFSVCFWSFGIWMLGRSKNKQTRISFKNLLNSGIIAIVLGLFFGLAGIKIVNFILLPAKWIGNASIPVALIVIGATLAKKDIALSIPYKAISILVLCRLILIPAIALCIIFLFKGLSPISKAIILLQAAMPSASSTSIFTKRFGGDTELASQGVFFTTLVSIITIPAFLSLI